MAIFGRNEKNQQAQDPSIALSKPSPAPSSLPEPPAYFPSDAPSQPSTRQFPQPQPHYQSDFQPQPQPTPQQQPQYSNATPLASLQDSPAIVDCPCCNHRALTRTDFESGNTTTAWAAGLCLLGCCLACIPFCIDGTKDVDHACGNCGAKLATWHRSGRTVVAPVFA